MNIDVNPLKVVGIIVLSVLFSLCVDEINLYMLEGEIYWTKYLSFGSMFMNYLFLDIAIVPIASVGLVLMGYWLCLLGKSNKYYIVIPTIIFGVRLIRIVYFLFADKSKTEVVIFEEIDYDILWYCCATVSSILIAICYIFVLVKMKDYADGKKIYIIE